MLYICQRLTCKEPLSFQDCHSCGLHAEYAEIVADVKPQIMDMYNIVRPAPGRFQAMCNALGVQTGICATMEAVRSSAEHRETDSFSVITMQFQVRLDHLVRTSAAHPKMAALLDIVSRHFQQHPITENSADASRVIIFTNLRETVHGICEALRQLAPLVQARYAAFWMPCLLGSDILSCIWQCRRLWVHLEIPSCPENGSTSWTSKPQRSRAWSEQCHPEMSSKER